MSATSHNDETRTKSTSVLQSGDEFASFPNANRCNRAAVYNYRNNTWTFYDLPNVSAGTNANVNSCHTYANATSLTYALVGVILFDQEDNRDRHTIHGR